MLQTFPTTEIVCRTCAPIYIYRGYDFEACLFSSAMNARADSDPIYTFLLDKSTRNFHHAYEISAGNAFITMLEGTFFTVAWKELRFRGT